MPRGGAKPAPIGGMPLSTMIPAAGAAASTKMCELAAAGGGPFTRMCPAGATPGTTLTGGGGGSRLMLGFRPTSTNQELPIGGGGPDIKEKAM